jgi:hypothetical protein
MTNQAPPSLWAKNPLLAWREIDGQTVIVSPADSVLHELNETGSFIWQRLDGKHSTEAIAAMLTQEYQVEPEIAQADTESLVALLAAQKLLVLGDDGRPAGAEKR